MLTGVLLLFFGSLLLYLMINKKMSKSMTRKRLLIAFTLKGLFLLITAAINEPFE